MVESGRAASLSVAVAQLAARRADYVTYDDDEIDQVCVCVCARARLCACVPVLV